MNQQGEIEIEDIPDPFLESLPTQLEVDRMKRITNELDRRQSRALNIYEPLDFQQEFHASQSPICVLAKGNRAGGSMCGFVEVARAATNSDPHNKYPDAGVIICVGYGEDHIGNVIYRYLFKPGAFKMIRDNDTGLWRTYRPWSPDSQVNGKSGDLGRTSVPAPPLIEPKEYEKPVWKKAGKEVFSRIKLKNGWEIIAGNSCGSPSHLQGVSVDYVHFDEDLGNPQWFDEMLPRILDNRGKIRWTAMHHSTNDVIPMLKDLSEEDKSVETPDVEFIKASTSQNYYIPKDMTRLAARVYKAIDEETYQKRFDGSVDTESSRVYVDYQKSLYSPRSEGHVGSTEAQKILRDNNFIPPKDWCIYAAIDPGTVICAVLFAAVPPPSLGDQIFFFDELYINRCDADKFGDYMKKKCFNMYIEAFIIDGQGAGLTDIGSGHSPRALYTKALRRHNIYSASTGHGFINGVKSRSVREDMFHQGLSLRKDGTHVIVIDEIKCPNLASEILGFKRKTARNRGRLFVTNESDRRFNTHLVDCAEYLVAHGCKYVSPIVSGQTGFERNRFKNNLKRNDRKLRAFKRLVGRAYKQLERKNKHG